MSKYQKNYLNEYNILKNNNYIFRIIIINFSSTIKKNFQWIINHEDEFPITRLRKIRFFFKKIIPQNLDGIENLEQMGLREMIITYLSLISQKMDIEFQKIVTHHQE